MSFLKPNKLKPEKTAQSSNCPWIRTYIVFPKNIFFSLITPKTLKQRKNYIGTLAEALLEEFWYSEKRTIESVDILLKSGGCQHPQWKNSINTQHPQY